VLPAARKRQIEELYRVTKERDEQTGDAFLSRYAGGSVWEYFAEGANALYSPRRDEYDTREIVRERLLEKDPVLAALVEEIMTEASVESCYAVAYVGLGSERLQEGNVDEAVAAYEKAVDRSPEEEAALGSLVYALTVGGRHDAALDWAGTAAMRAPQSGDLAVGRARVLWHGGYGLEAARKQLAEARDEVREEDRHAVDQAIGSYAWIAGDAETAVAAYGRVLERQADDPTGLWGLASAQALAGDFSAAFETYATAVEHRTGIEDLRADFARDLLRAGEVDRAAEQVEAGILLDPEHPELLALRAWIELERGQLPLASASSAEALEHGPWSDWAVYVRGRVLAAEGRDAEAEEMLAPLRKRVAEEAPPEYVYREKWGSYREVHTLPAILRELLAS
jgi:tetratricopeptide (TPR) repeat protein